MGEEDKNVSVATPPENQSISEIEGENIQKALDAVHKQLDEENVKELEVPQSDEDPYKRIEYENLKAAINSDEQYIKIVKDVVENSKCNLGDIGKDKKELREQLIAFCTNILGIQLGVLCVFFIDQISFSHFRTF